jgi:hypothetical protein
MHRVSLNDSMKLQSHMRACFRACIFALAAATSASAADIASYGIIKTQNFLQTDAAGTVADPSAAFTITFSAEPSDFTAVNSIAVEPPSGAAIPLPDAGAYIFSDIRSTQAQLDGAYKIGVYRFDFDTVNDGVVTTPLALPADAFGNTPLILDFAGLSAVVATGDLNLKWTPFSQGAAGDFIRVRIESDSGFDVFDSGSLGTPSTLNGLSTGVTVPGGTFEPGNSYKGHLTFARIAVRDEITHPGAVGTVAFARQTQFKITAVNAGGGSTAPTLLFANPADGAVGVPVNSAIAFVFSGAMNPSQAISWSGGGVNPASFKYSWPQANTLVCTYTGDLPGGSTVSYTLNPPGSASGFKNPAGAALVTVSGSFSTAGIFTPPTATAPRLEIPVTLPDGSFKIRISGQPSSVCVVETSADLKGWTAQPQITLSASGTAEVTIAGAARTTFVRARTR